MDAKGGITQYAYDAGDHLIKVTDPRGLVTTYSYDGLGLLWKQVSPDTGTTNFSYDSYARLATKTLASGLQNVYSYDALNRLTKITANDGLVQTWSYDTCTHGFARLCSANGARTAISYSYTPEGWIASRSFNVDGTAYSVKYSYNSMGRPTVVIYPDGRQFNYTYSKGVVSGVSIGSGSGPAYMAGAITYRPMDMAMSGWTTQNGLHNTLGYDNDLRPTAITVPGVQSLSFSYDAADRINKITNGIDNAMTQMLAYDPLDRLTSVSSGVDNESYMYDADGNRLSQTINGVVTTFAPAADSNRLLSRSSGGTKVNYSYDANGNLFGYGAGTPLQMFYYNGRNRLWQTRVGGTQAVYEVGPEGQRLRKYTSTTSTYFAPDVNGNLLAEKNNGTWYDYVWLNRRLIGVIVNGGIFSLHDDQTGRPQVMTEPNVPDIDWSAQNEPFDRTVTTNAWGPFNVGFPGQYFDAEDGLYYNGNRDYDPALGRYIEFDPLGLASGMNGYFYAANDPISNIDPLGLSCNKALQFFNQVNQQFVDTNKTLPGVLAPPGIGIITGGAMAQAVGAPTMMGAATQQVANNVANYAHFAADTGMAAQAVNWAGALKGATLNYLAVSAVWEAGLYVGTAAYEGYSDARYGMPQDSSQNCGCQ